MQLQLRWTHNYTPIGKEGRYFSAPLRCLPRSSKFARPMDSVDSLLCMFCIQFSPQDWRIFQHAGEAAFDGFDREFPAISAIYFAEDDTNDIDKGLQGCTSLVGFIMVIVGWWKKAIDMRNDLITKNKEPFISCTDGHAAPLTALLHRAAICSAIGSKLLKLLIVI